MNADCLIIANESILEHIEPEAIEQLANCAKLPGVVSPVCGMPDMHWGYGEPIGSVTAFKKENGLISVGMVGFDINCGINLLKTNLTEKEVKPKINELIEKLFKNIPCGVGSKGKLRLTETELDEVLKNGAEWCVKNGYGNQNDITNLEEHGKMEGADPSKVSDLAKKRGRPQLGTLGAGNHFLEIQVVDEVYDDKYGLKKGDVCVMLHCGSRGLGHQIATDYLKIHGEAVKKYNIKIPDQQLVCAPFDSQEGQDYYKAMKCAVNYAFANRLVMTQWIRDTFKEVFEKDVEMPTIYGIAHNIAKVEKFNGEELIVHRKGATRSYPNTPAIIAGSMGTASYLLEGTEEAMKKTYGSTCHGAGRIMSRGKAIHLFKGEQIKEELKNKGIVAKSTSPKVLAEESPNAYKDVNEVIESAVGAGISKKVAKLVPIGVVKG